MSSGSEFDLALSVRELVDFAARSGDLQLGQRRGPSNLEGILGHQRLQRQRDSSWQSEYKVQSDIDFKGLRVRLRGRIDLLCPTSSPPIIEELKTCLGAPDNLDRASRDEHLAQAKLYAWLYALQLNEPAENSGQFRVRVTWLDLLEDKCVSEDSIHSFQELQQFAHSLLEIYIAWHARIEVYRKRLITSSAAMEWPFENYRPAQHDFARAVYRTICNGGSLLVEAPTGSGKTLTTLFAALKSMPERPAAQLLYLSAKTQGQRAAVSTLELLCNRGLQVAFLVLQARDRACPCRQRNAVLAESCTDENGICTRTLGFFDRLPQARMDCLELASLTTENLRTIADRYCLCPFELSLQLLPWVSLVVCDYNYVFDPLTGLFNFEESQRLPILLIDEAHNLPERARAMYSAKLNTSEIRQLAGGCHGAYAALKPLLREFARKLDSLTENEEPNAQKRLESAAQLCESILQRIQAVLATPATQQDLFSELPPNFKEWHRELLRFSIVAGLPQTNHQLIVDHRRTGKSASTNLQNVCLDAAQFLTQNMQQTAAQIAFSGTLQPLWFYHSTLGLPETCTSVALPQSFPKENLLSLNCKKLDTRWGHREQSLVELVKLLMQVFQARQGKYLACFPSYAYLESVIKQFERLAAGIPIVTQQRDATEDDQKAFLDNFFEKSQPVLGFAILGGLFAEGVDYAGPALDGVIIVGSGMPQPTQRQQMMRQHYDSMGVDGFAFAYRFPGMTRVIQTAGRLIRSATDRGILLLLDPRFSRSDFRELMPTHWQLLSCNSSEDVLREIRSWESRCRKGERSIQNSVSLQESI